MEDFEKYYNKALEFLSYRPRSEKEVRDKLKTKNVELEVIDRIISKLKEKKFINDGEFAKGWIRSRLEYKPRSMKLIKFELKHKGIGEELIDRLIHNSEFIIQNDLESAKRLVEKKLGRFRNKFGMTREEKYQKLGRFLASKGFNWDIIKKSIDLAERG